MTTTPHLEAIVHADGTATLTGPPSMLNHGGEHSIAISADSVDAARTSVIEIVADIARRHGEAVQLLTKDPSGQWPVQVHPDKTISPAAAPDPRGVVGIDDLLEREESPTATSAAEEDDPPRHASLAVVEAADHSPDQTPPASATATEAAAGAQRPDEGTGRRRAVTPTDAASFLTADMHQDPATRGWRGWLTRMGWQQAPTAEELAERDDVRRVSQHWAGPRTIAIANPKGGTGKTPCTALLSAVFAQHGGSGVVAWDANQLRGTLGWQTETGPHHNHVLHMLGAADRLMQPHANVADLAALVHHQQEKFEVLRSVPDRLPKDQQLVAADFDKVHRVLSKYYRLILIDSGNDESAETWMRMIDKADQLVVPTTTSPKSTEAARLMLGQLGQRDDHSARLAAGAVVLVSQTEPHDPAADDIADQFSGFVREAVVVPKDTAVMARWLRHASLAEETQRAYLHAAATIADGLTGAQQ